MQSGPDPHRGFVLLNSQSPLEFCSVERNLERDELLHNILGTLTVLLGQCDILATLAPKEALPQLATIQETASAMAISLARMGLEAPSSVPSRN